MSDRLDRIENILEATATRLDQTAILLNRVAHQQAGNTIAIAQLSAENKRFAAKCKAIIENAKTDREAFQAEIRRIWEYLLRRSENGHDSNDG